MKWLDDLWQPPPNLPSLSNHEIHIWGAALDDFELHIEPLAALLSDDEQLRVNRFYFERDKKRFILGRGILRTILSYYLELPPHQLQFSYGLRGKPALVKFMNRHALDFNMSHSQGMAVYAVTRGTTLGIDLEYIRPMSRINQLVERCFSPKEQEIFNTFSPQQQQQAFFRYWTCKEAFVKALGDGLAFPLHQFDVMLTPDKAAKLLSIQGNISVAAGWFLQELMQIPGYAAALAAKGTDWNLTYYQWGEFH